MAAGVNRAICLAYQRGILTSATLMATGLRVEDALKMAKNLSESGVSIGCHVVLVDGKPVLHDHEIRSLIGVPGSFRSKLQDLNRAVLWGKVDEREIQAEATAQVQFIEKNGVAISHIDSHKHTQWMPRVFRPLMLAAVACGVSAIRNPFVGHVTLKSQLLQRKYSWKQYVKIQLLRRYAGEFSRLAAKHGLHTTDGIIGVFDPCLLNIESFRRFMTELPEGTWELCCHPGFNDDDLALTTTRLREQRAREFTLLTSCQARELVEKNGIQLISFAELNKGRLSPCLRSTR